MKFEMTGFEFSEFCSQLANSHAFPRLQELEESLKTARIDLDEAIAERVETWNKYDRVYSENEVLRCTNSEVSLEIRQLKALVLQLQDKLMPNRVECSYSRAFALHRGGQKIMAIKEIRALASIGLREAKFVVEGTFMNSENYPDLANLSEIFRDMMDVETDQEVQRDRMRKLVVASADQLDSILKGTFHTETAIAA